MKYALKDPKLLKAGPDYPTLGPIGLCGCIQEEYNVLFTEQDWPELASTRPAANNSSIDNENTEDKKVNSKGRICFSCGSNTHFRRNPECPQFSSAKKVKPATTTKKSLIQVSRRKTPPLVLK